MKFTRSPSLLGFLFAFLAAIPLWAEAPTSDDVFIRAKTGDLLFLNLPGNLGRAIEEAAKQQFGLEGPNLSHVGILMRHRDQELMILHFESGEIRSSTLRDLLHSIKIPQTADPSSELGVLWSPSSPRYRDLMRAVAMEMEARLGEESPSLACAEGLARLINSNAHQRLIRFYPKQFGRPGTWARNFWEKHFKWIGKPLPEGEPGLNPLGFFLQVKGLGIVR